MSKIPVNGLYKYCDQMLSEKWGYIQGTAGVICTQKVIDQSVDKFPQNADVTKRYGKQWLGRMVADCSGVPVYIWRQYNLSIPHGSNSIRMQSVGAMTTTPKPGYAAFKVEGDDYYHIGIVAKDGKTVYEAKSTRYGFVTSDVSEWDCFAPFNDVIYSEVEPVPEQGKQVDYQATVTTESGKLNLRSGPGTNYPVIDRIPKGTVVTVWMEYSSGWRFIDYNQEQGYASGEYLTPLPPGTSVPDEPGPEPIAAMTRLRRSDGVEIVLEGDWSIVRGDD